MHRNETGGKRLGNLIGRWRNWNRLDVPDNWEKKENVRKLTE